MELEKHTFGYLMSLVCEDKKDEFYEIYSKMHGFTEEERNKEWLLKHVCEVLMVSPEQISSKCKKGRLPLARQIYMSISRECYPDTLESIAKLINRVHSTALYAHRVVRSDYFSSGKRRAIINSVINSLPARERTAAIKYVKQ